MGKLGKFKEDKNRKLRTRQHQVKYLWLVRVSIEQKVWIRLL